MRSGNLLTSGSFAAVSGLSIKQLRHYDAIGLLRPHSVDPASGYRYYATTQVERAVTIGLLRAIGLPIRDIITALRDRSPRAARAHLERQREQVRHAERLLPVIECRLMSGRQIP